MAKALLHIEDLAIDIHTPDGTKELIRGFHLRLEESKIFALVGASGSGKTTIGLSILRLLPAAMAIRAGKILFENRDVLALSEEEMRKIRGGDIAMVFQEPLSAFNPVFTIGYQVSEVLRFHTGLQGNKRQEKVWELLEAVGIADPKRIAGQYPHQLSGGLRQRAMIAQALAAGPKLVIADEPTSSLDVTLQAHIIELFRKIRRDFHLSILLITHDLGVVGELADEVAVLAEGWVVEQGPAQNLLKEPRHPFTRELVNSIL